MSVRADALVVVDVQRALMTGDSAVPHADALLERLRSVVAAARAAGVPVVHLQDDGVDDPRIRRGSVGWQLVLSVADGDPVVQKASDDGFDGTELESVLQGAGVSRPCLVGIQSEMCVAATARGAMARGLVVVLPRDGHATYDIPADGASPAVPAAQVSRVAEWSLGAEVVAPDSVDEVVFGVRR